MIGSLNAKIELSAGATAGLTGGGSSGCIGPRMKKLLIPVFALGLISLAPVRADEDSPLAQQMEALDDAYKAFRREEDPVKGAALAREAQDAVLKAVTITPARVENGGMPVSKEAAMAAYRKQMGQLFVTLCEVEEAFIAKDLDKVKELVTALKGSKKEGHDTFMEEEE